MEYKPDVPTIIMRRQDLTYREKSFLLWCWAQRSSDESYILISRRKNRTTTWYADYFSMPQQTMSEVFVKLRNKKIIYTIDKNKFEETTLVNFGVFR